MNRRIALLWISILLCVSMSSAQAPEYVITLLKDLIPGAVSSNPVFLADVNGTLFFHGTEVAHGAELWKSDGTPSGTVMVKDINPGSSGSSMPVYLTNANGTLFFAAIDGTNGVELWESDGTSSGTFMVKDIYPGTASSIPSYLTNVNGTIFFQANDGTNGIELWKSDGTSYGTTMVKDINPGAGNSNANNFTNVNGTLFFTATDGTNGIELWKSNGTLSGTVLVKDIRPGVNSSTPAYLTNVNGTLFFSATDGTNGNELWKSDGTASGTVLVKDIYPGSNNSSPQYLTDVNGTLFFQAWDNTNGPELWKSDGTISGTVMVQDIYPGSVGSAPEYLTNVNGTLFFSANDGTHGWEVWKSDGTSSGTVLVKDIYSGEADSYPISLTDVNGVLFFSAVDLASGYELWKSDGTSAGTALAKDINPGAGDSHPEYLTNVNGTLFFHASNGTDGIELWKCYPREYAGKFLSITDIPRDQGGQVHIKWQHSHWDTTYGPPIITSYSLWRKIPTGVSAEARLKYPVPEGIVVDDTLANYYYLMSIPALQLNQYNVVAPTLEDSTSAGNAMAYFLLVSHTADPREYYITFGDSGYSVDNLAPAVVTGLTATVQSGPSVHLNWNPDMSDPDLHHYDVYRSDVSGFTPNPSLKIGTTGTNGFTDSSPHVGDNNYYRIVTVDVHGNESVPSAETGVPVTVTEVFSLDDRWNMVSLPLGVQDPKKTTLFPTAVSEALMYKNTYIQKESLSVGLGYWLKFDGSGFVSIAGVLRLRDTVSLAGGWNMIGSISRPIAAASITSDPGGMVTSQFFSYRNGYQRADSIQPGKGYWVKVREAGKLILAASGAEQSAKAIRIVEVSELPPPSPDGRRGGSGSEALPREYSLQQNYPNPFNPTTTVKYSLPSESRVTVRIMNTLGQEVARLVDGVEAAGYKFISWNPSNVASGIYFYRIEATSTRDPSETFSHVRKMTFVK